MADFGGAIENRESEPLIINVILKGNESLVSGGAVANFGGAPRFINSVFSGNTTTYIGGGVLNNGSDAVAVVTRASGPHVRAGWRRGHPRSQRAAHRGNQSRPAGSHSAGVVSQ